MNSTKVKKETSGLKFISFFRFLYLYCIISFCSICLIDIFFMPPRSKIGGHIVFVLSVILLFCHSVLLSETLTLLINFWTVSARALIFHMGIPCDKTFPWVPLFFTLWPLLWILTNFLKIFTLLITFEKWVLELWYFIRVHFLPFDLALWVWPIFKHC